MVEDKVGGNDGGPFNVHSFESVALQLNLQPIFSTSCSFTFPQGENIPTTPTLEPTDLYCGLVGLEQQSRSRLQEGPQLDLVVPTDGELTVPQGEDLIDGSLSQQVVLQLLWESQQTHSE